VKNAARPTNITLKTILGLPRFSATIARPGNPSHYRAATDSSLVILEIGDIESPQFLSTMSQNSVAAPSSIWRETNSYPKPFSLTP
jgi:hypothetical protein